MVPTGLIFIQPGEAKAARSGLRPTFAIAEWHRKCILVASKTLWAVPSPNHVMRLTFGGPAMDVCSKTYDLEHRERRSRRRDELLIGRRPHELHRSPPVFSIRCDAGFRRPAVYRMRHDAAFHLGREKTGVAGCDCSQAARARWSSSDDGMLRNVRSSTSRRNSRRSTARKPDLPRDKQHLPGLLSR